MSADGLACVNDVAVRWAEVVARAAWQGGVALLLVWIVCRAVPRLSADLRCWLWRLAFLKLLIAVLWSAPVSLPLLPAPPAAAVVPPAASVALAASAIPRPGGRDVGLPANPPSAPCVPWPSPMSGLLLLWLAGVTACGLGVAREWRAGRRLVRACAPVPDGTVNACCAALSQRYGWGRPPRLLQAEGLTSPMLLGAWRPAILLPSTLLAECSLAELELILAHELAHGKRRDLLWGWLPAVARALFFFHPLVWLAQQELRLAQEMACDAMAVRVTRAPAAAYGDLLLKVAARGGRSLHGAPVALGVFESYQTLARRLKAMRTLGCTSRPCHRIAAMLLGLTGLLGLVPWRVTAQAAPTAPAKVPWPGFYACDPPDGREGQDLMRLNRPSVRADLMLTTDQLARVDAVMSALRREQDRILRSMRQPEWDKLWSSVKQAHQQVAAILTAGQMDRLRQIHLQYDGAFALQENDIAEELRLTPEQRQQIQKIYKEHRRAVTVPSSLSRDPKAEQAAIRNFGHIYRQNQSRILAVLTGEQRDQFLRMLGRPLQNLEDSFLFRLRKS